MAPILVHGIGTLIFWIIFGRFLHALDRFDPDGWGRSLWALISGALIALAWSFLNPLEWQQAFEMQHDWEYILAWTASYFLPKFILMGFGVQCLRWTVKKSQSESIDQLIIVLTFTLGFVGIENIYLAHENQFQLHFFQALWNVFLHLGMVASLFSMPFYKHMKWPVQPLPWLGKALVLALYGGLVYWINTQQHWKFFAQFACAGLALLSLGWAKQLVNTALNFSKHFQAGHFVNTNRLLIRGMMHFTFLLLFAVALQFFFRKRSAVLDFDINLHLVLPLFYVGQLQLARMEFDKEKRIPFALDFPLFISITFRYFLPVVRYKYKGRGLYEEWIYSWLKAPVSLKLLNSPSGEEIFVEGMDQEKVKGMVHYFKVRDTSSQKVYWLRSKWKGKRSYADKYPIVALYRGSDLGDEIAPKFSAWAYLKPQNPLKH